MALLRIEGLTKNLSGLVALKDFFLEAREGEIVSIIGPNGAGKTTLFNLITGFLAPTSGRILFRGEDLTGKRPHEIARRGIVRTFQNTKVFPFLTVDESVRTAHHLATGYGFGATLLNSPSKRKEEKKIAQATEGILHFLGLQGEREVQAQNLPYGHQRLLEIAIALAAGPRLLLLDEPATGMNQEETRSVMDLIRKIREQGITILLVEHDMKVVMNISERITVLNYGVKIAEGSPREVQQDQQVIESYLGKGFAEGRSV